MKEEDLKKEIEREIEDKISHIRGLKVMGIKDDIYKDEIDLRILKGKLEGFQLGKSQAQKDILEMIENIPRSLKGRNNRHYAIDEIIEKIKGEK